MEEKEIPTGQLENMGESDIIDKGYKVDIVYFKPSGKLYTTGSYVTRKETWFKVTEEISEKIARSDMPSIKDCNGFIVLANSNEHPGAYHSLFNTEATIIDYLTSDNTDRVWIKAAERKAEIINTENKRNIPNFSED